jgi:DNA polymerase sigma
MNGNLSGEYFFCFYAENHQIKLKKKRTMATCEEIINTSKQEPMPLKKIQNHGNSLEYVSPHVIFCLSNHSVANICAIV